VLADRRVALAVEGRVHQRELPGGRGLLGDDPVAATVEVDVLHDVAGLVDAGEGRAQAEVHVAEEGVLGHAEPHRRRGRIALADLDVDIAHRRIEGAGIGVADLGGGGAHGGDRHGDLADLVLVVAGEHDHRAHAFLEARSLGAEHEHRPGRADAEHAHAGRDQQAAAQAIAAGGQEDQAVAGLVVGGVDGLLDGVGVVGLAVAHALDDDGARIVRRLGQDGLGRRYLGKRGDQNRRQQDRSHAVPQIQLGGRLEGAPPATTLDHGRNDTRADAPVERQLHP
jgi:hypothetical protein